MPLISAANVRAEIQGLSASDDTELGLLIAEADALAAGWMYWPRVSATVAPTLTVSTYVDYLDGPDIDDIDAIVLRTRPVVAVTSIYDDVYRLYAAGDLVASTEYTLDGDAGIVRLDGDATHAWSHGSRAIKVTYTAGWTDGSAPADIRRALLIIVADLWQRRHVPGLPSATLQDRPTDLKSSLRFSRIMPNEAAQILGRYRLWERAARG